MERNLPAFLSRKQRRAGGVENSISYEKVVTSSRLSKDLGTRHGGGGGGALGDSLRALRNLRHSIPVDGAQRPAAAALSAPGGSA